MALETGRPVLPLFIFDTTILNDLERKADRRVSYFHGALQDMHQQLQQQGSGILCYHATPLEAFQQLLQDFDVEAVYFNHDYEPEAIRRDAAVTAYLRSQGVDVRSFKDQVIFEKDEVVKADGSPYVVYTPYAQKWRQLLSMDDYRPHRVGSGGFAAVETSVPSLEALGFVGTEMVFQRPIIDERKIEVYDAQRDFPARDATSRLSVALRFGTMSIREAVAAAVKWNAVWLQELIWREFFMQVLFHFPHVVQRSFRSEYDKIEWRNNEAEFVLWCEGRTGYPIVDAGMHELNETGFMHNRVRMITASFLCKHLLIDWRWGEAYFAQMLNDYELASNNGNWQWAAGSGCDAAPYFRIFNPTLQTKKFDPKCEYVRRWYPTFETTPIPEMVPHDYARKRALAAYKAALD